MLLRLKYFDWSKSEGAFKNITGENDESAWAVRCNSILKEMYGTTDSGSSESSLSVSNESCETAQENMEKKRKASSDLIEKIIAPSKRKESQGSKSTTETIAERVYSHRVGTYQKLFNTS